MKTFGNHFKTKLYETIAEVEKVSSVEIVTIVKKQSGNYNSYLLWAASIFAFAVFSFFMFIPIIFGDYLIYMATIAAFSLVVAAGMLIPAFQRFLVNELKLEREVEVLGRAVFQKSGIRHTRDKTGMLIFCSLFEKRVLLLPDRGIEMAIPQDEWDTIEQNFKNIFSLPNPADALLIELNNTKAVFEKYLPVAEDDINELPDDLDVEI